MNEVALPEKSNQAAVIENVLIRGDLSTLSEAERVNYYRKVCDSVGLNPFTRPLEYIKLNGRLVLYAKKDATDQLRQLNKISIKIVAREEIGDVFSVTAQATTPEGRCDESIGAVFVGGAKGDVLANLLMKAETKAKRRVTLSICGLGLLDETEVETIHPNEGKSEHQAVSLPKVYRIPLKKFEGKTLEEVDPIELSKYVLDIEKWASDKKKPGAETLIFIEKAKAHLEELETVSDFEGADDLIPPAE